MFALALSLSVVGCGNSAEPKQEEPQETRQELDYDDVEQGSDYSDIIGKEFEMMIFM